jgi:two-component system cell cycle response regulator DivK
MTENSQTHGAAKTILLVEDNDIVSKVYREKMERAGFLVELAQDGLTALKLLSQMKPGLVVLDLDIPKLSGVDVLKFIRADRALRATPVIVLSAGFMSDLAKATSEIGVEFTFLKSSCTPAKLLEVVRHILEGVPFELDPSLRLSVRKEAD